MEFRPWVSWANCSHLMNPLRPAPSDDERHRDLGRTSSRGHPRSNWLGSHTDSSGSDGLSTGLRMYRQFSNQIYKTVVVVWLSLSIASVILAAMTWFDLSRKLAEGSEAVAVQGELEAILRHLLDAETGQRGYTITGEESFLQPLLDAETNLPGRFERLAEFV